MSLREEEGVSKVGRMCSRTRLTRRCLRTGGTEEGVVSFSVGQTRHRYRTKSGLTSGGFSLVIGNLLKRSSSPESP